MAKTTIDILTDEEPVQDDTEVCPKCGHSLADEENSDDQDVPDEKEPAKDAAIPLLAEALRRLRRY